MRKAFYAALACAAVLGFAATAMAIEFPKEKMTLKMPAGGAMTKAPVDFSHQGHAGLKDCKVCHHNWDGKSELKKGTKGANCSEKGCHDNLDAKNKTEKDSYYMAYHKPTAKASCVGCHSATKKAGAKSGPVVCKDCHPDAAK